MRKDEILWRDVIPLQARCIKNTVKILNVATAMSLLFEASLLAGTGSRFPSQIWQEETREI